MRWLGAGLCVLFWTSLAGAQAAAAKPPPVAHAPVVPDTQPSTPEPQSPEEKHAAKEAQVLNPKDYGPAFNVGAQAELLVPGGGLSSMLLGYDAVWVQTEVSVGLGIGRDLERSQDPTDVYIASLRLSFPIHRGVRSDFSLLVGGGGMFIDPEQGETENRVTAGGGAKFRAFFTPNVAVAGTLGLLATFGEGDPSFLLGARPLGSAAVVYFFR